MNILLTSVGRRSYIVSYFKDALKGIGEVHVSNSVESYSMELADKSVITPLIYDESYIDFILSYSVKNKIKAIIPLFDIDLPILAKNKIRFKEKNINVIVSSFEVTQICNDKWLTYKFLKGKTINTPKTYLTISDCMNALRKEEIMFPLIVKPRWGMGSLGIFQADDINELKVFYKKVKKNIIDSYLKYESAFDVEKDVIIQEKLIGNEFGLDVLNDLNANFLTCISKRKLSIRDGETESAEIIDDSELLILGKKLSESLKHIANLDVDCIKMGGSYFVIELNNRFGGQYPFCQLAGADFPKAIVNMLIDKEVPSGLLASKIGAVGFKDINPIKIK